MFVACFDLVGWWAGPAAVLGVLSCRFWIFDYDIRCLLVCFAIVSFGC